VQFVDCVIGEMHESVFQVVASGSCVDLSSKTGQTLLVHENAEGVGACHEDVDSHVELETIDKKWLVEVALDYAALAFEFWMERGVLSMWRVR
jgi:hypothetical protein